MIPLAVPCQKRGDDWVGGINTDSDPFFSNVISLLHFNGSGYSQVVVDEIGNTWDVYTGVGSDPSAGIVASQHGIDSAFVINYNSSEYSDTAELRLETPLEFSIFDSTIGDCTIELFFKNTEGVEGWLLYSNTGSGTFPSGTSSSFRAGLYSDRLAVIGEYYTPSTGNYFLPDFEVPLEFVPHGVWNHIAFVVSGNTLKCFINGVLRKSETISRTSGLSYEAPNHYLTVSSANKTVDEFRITNGVARYSANFARPIKQFPDHDQVFY